MRSSVAVLCLVCSASAVQAQSASQSQPQTQQQPQQQSAWQAQFSGNNWSIEETRVEPLLVRFNMKMNRFYSGGIGEARLIFENRAQALVRAGDYYTYQTVEYKESLNSFLFGSQRVVEGTIRLIPKL
jgi:hypothetical protein